jgi:centrosomal protein CEP104
MQFLSHQCKISSKVEIYAYLPKDANLRTGVEIALNPSEMKFTKVGYFFFASNETSNFQSRELKTVYLVDINALYIKITLHKCHVNNLNIFNQVGLIAISIFGEPLLAGPTPAAAIKSLGHDQGGFQEMEYNMQFDEETLNRLRMLEKARDRAEKNEDYSEAKKLNEAIVDLKRVGVNLQKLEERKAIAVKNKDYDSAMILKKVARR